MKLLVAGILSSLLPLANAKGQEHTDFTREGWLRSNFPSANQQPPLQTEQESNTRLKPIVLQLAGGVVAGSTILLLAYFYTGDEDDALLQANTSVGLPYVLTTASAVHFIGHLVEKKEHGRFWATLTGTLIGAVIPVTAFPLDSEFEAITLLAPSIGGILGYQLSKSNPRGILNLHQNRVRWGLPSVGWSLSSGSDGPLQLNYRCRLVNVIF